MSDGRKAREEGRGQRNGKQVARDAREGEGSRNGGWGTRKEPHRGGAGEYEPHADKAQHLDLGTKTDMARVRDGHGTGVGTIVGTSAVHAVEPQRPQGLATMASLPPGCKRARLL